MLPLLVMTGKDEKVSVRGEDYMQKLVEQANIHFIATGKIKETGQIITAMKVIDAHPQTHREGATLFITVTVPLTYITNRVSQTGLDEGTEKPDE